MATPDENPAMDDCIYESFATASSANEASMSGGSSTNEESSIDEESSSIDDISTPVKPRRKITSAMLRRPWGEDTEESQEISPKQAVALPGSSLSPYSMSTESYLEMESLMTPLPSSERELSSMIDWCSPESNHDSTGDALIDKTSTEMRSPAWNSNSPHSTAGGSTVIGSPMHDSRLTGSPDFTSSPLKGSVVNVDHPETSIDLDASFDPADTTHGSSEIFEPANSSSVFGSSEFFHSRSEKKALHEHLIERGLETEQFSEIYPASPTNSGIDETERSAEIAPSFALDASDDSQLRGHKIASCGSRDTSSQTNDTTIHESEMTVDPDASFDRTATTHCSSEICDSSNMYGSSEFLDTTSELQERLAIRAELLGDTPPHLAAPPATDDFDFASRMDSLAQAEREISSPGQHDSSLNTSVDLSALSSSPVDFYHHPNVSDRCINDSRETYNPSHRVVTQISPVKSTKITSGNSTPRVSASLVNSFTTIDDSTASLSSPAVLASTPAQVRFDKYYLTVPKQHHNVKLNKEAGDKAATNQIKREEQKSAIKPRVSFKTADTPVLRPGEPRTLADLVNQSDSRNGSHSATPPRSPSAGARLGIANFIVFLVKAAGVGVGIALVVSAGAILDKVRSIDARPKAYGWAIIGGLFLIGTMVIYEALPPGREVVQESAPGTTGSQDAVRQIREGLENEMPKQVEEIENLVRSTKTAQHSLDNELNKSKGPNTRAGGPAMDDSSLVKVTRDIHSRLHDVEVDHPYENVVPRLPASRVSKPKQPGSTSKPSPKGTQIQTRKSSLGTVASNSVSNASFFSTNPFPPASVRHDIQPHLAWKTLQEKIAAAEAEKAVAKHAGYDEEDLDTQLAWALKMRKEKARAAAKAAADAAVEGED